VKLDVSSRQASASGNHKDARLLTGLAALGLCFDVELTRVIGYVLGSKPKAAVRSRGPQ
jgi:hypothetical protein